MSDLSLVLFSFSLVEIVAFIGFATMLQRYKEFLKPPNIFAIIFQKNAFFFIFGKFLTELAINQPQNACKDVFLTLAQRMAISQGESRNISPFYQQAVYP